VAGVVVALCVSGISFVVLFLYVRRRTGQGAILKETREAAREIVREIDRITDRDSHLVEQRVGKLKALLDEADRRILTIEHAVVSRERREDVYREIGRQSTRESVSSSAGEAQPQDKPQQDKAQPDKREEAIRLAKAGLPSGKIAARLGMTVTEVEMAIFRH
jgi:DNA-binding NarL/FixJ family response regulator